jgi:hypothetical protein
MLSGFGGVPGTRMRTIRFRRIENILERRGFSVVPRRNARPAPVPNTDNSEDRFAGLQDDIPVLDDDFPQYDGDITVITIPLDNKRPVASTRKSRAENWVETEKILTGVMYHAGQRHQCICSRPRDCKRVRFISLESYIIKEVDYCQCAASCSALLCEGEGFFPSSPRKPGTVFSLRLLRTLHAQAVLGSVSKLAWSAGLHMVFEKDLKTALPRFDEEVCLERHVQCCCFCTNNCSFGMPTTTGSQFGLRLKPGSAMTWNPSRRTTVSPPLANGKKRN